MSVEASKWARMADVQKSSSKLVLLSLAQLVRYDAEQWTVFASIDYLAKVTHLNRKTVIEALGRLRDLGAIKDTGRRAGDNRSSIIYRLSPKGVPLVDLATSNVAAGGAAVQPMPQQDLNLGFDADTPHDQDVEMDAEIPASQPSRASDCPGWDDDTAPAAEHFASDSIRPAPVVDILEKAASCPETLALCFAKGQEAPQQYGASMAGLRASTQRSSPAGLEDAPRYAGDHGRGSAKGGRARGKIQPAAGAGPTRLPAAWTLPDRWRMWTQRERPLWSVEKIDAMATTFGAYMRSRPGVLGTSADWFESWRLWVFREREPQEARKPWQATWSGIVAKGKALGVDKAPNEPEAHFKARVFCAAGLPPPY